MDDLVWVTTVTVLLFLLMLLSTTTDTSACNLYNDNGGTLNIISTSDTPTSVVNGRAVTLFCEAENFCQIEWLRNGLPKDGFEHAWNFSTDNPEAYIELQDFNQTLKFTRAYNCDVQSMWTCVVSNETESQNYTMELIVTDVPVKTAPVFPSNDLCPPNATAALGQALELFCPCTAGDIATKDVSLEWFKLVESGEDGEEARWVPVAKLGENGTAYTLGRMQLDLVPYCPYVYSLTGSTVGSTIGQSLYINKLTEAELGTYRVVATRQDDSEYRGLNATQTVIVTESIPPRSINDTTIAVAIGTSFAVLILISLLAGIVWQRKGVDIRLMLKDRYGKTESQDGKTYDAFIAYGESDADTTFVIKTLMPALQEAGYIPFIREIDGIGGEDLVEQLISSLESSRRCILVISPDFIRARHSALQLEVATNQMLRHQSKIIPLLFKSATKDQIKDLRGLVLILSALRAISWDDGPDANNEKSLKKLMLKMPPVTHRGRSNSQLPLSSRGALGGQPQHGSEQCLVPPQDSSIVSTSGDVTMATDPTDTNVSGLNSNGAVLEPAV